MVREMLIGFRDLKKFISVTVVICCAAFVCTLFLNYNLDLIPLEDEIATPQARAMYDALVAGGKVVVGVASGCMVLTTAVLLIFYVKNYIDSNGKSLGILKALGYSRIKIAKYFWVFGLSVLLGAGLGLLGAHLYMPAFYAAQNSEGALPELSPQFHLSLALAELILPTAFSSMLAVFYAYFKMKTPVMDLMKETRAVKTRKSRAEKREVSFLADLRRNTLRSRVILVFFVGFSAFCFSAMTQMSISMNDLTSAAFSWMILLIGLILAFMTLLISLASVLKANGKTIAMMKVFGYSEKECSRSILGGYRPISYLGFAVGTAYQYFLLRIMFNVVFSDIESVPAYHFDWKAFLISFAAFVVAYELILCYYARKIGGQSVKSVMLE